MCVETVDDRCPLALDELDARVEGSKVSVSTWRAPRIVDINAPWEEAEDVEERQVHEDHVVDGDPHALALVPRVAHDAMVVHGRLRKSGRPGRVEEECRLRGIHGLVARPERVVADTPAILQHAAPGDGPRVGVRETTTTWRSAGKRAAGLAPPSGATSRSMPR